MEKQYKHEKGGDNNNEGLWKINLVPPYAF